MIKRTTGTGNWQIYDNMRGMPARYQDTSQVLFPNTNGAEQTTDRMGISATGFNTNVGANEPYIYIAIRRGPMKVPTVGTTVFNPVINTGNGTAGTILTAGFPVDLDIGTIRNQTGYTYAIATDRLRGAGLSLQTGLTAAETNDPNGITSFANQTGVVVGNGATYSWPNQSPWLYINWFFKRAPSFFDEVCWSGNTSSSNRRITHNLTVAPELIITKVRSGADYWYTYTATTGINSLLYLNLTDAVSTGGNPWTTVAPTATDFGYNELSFGNAGTWVGYLFATCAGVSKVGSYTGTGTLTTINCGFAAGARFVLIKKTSGTSNWFVWDSTRGMVAGTDPSLNLNNTQAEANVNSVYTITTGFQLLASPAVDVNTNGGSYIFLAIA
jgi:hypothetical protein